MKYIIVIALFLFLCGCGGTHGKIKSYYFEFSNNDLVSIIDSILLSNHEYSPRVDKSSGWIYFRIPKIGDQFKIRIGGESQVTLISAGEKGKKTKWDSDLGYFEKKRLIKSFEKNFVRKIKTLKPRSLDILREPFTLSINIHADTVYWPHYVIKYDTLVQYPLPDEIDSLGIDYFLDLVIDFSDYMKQELFIKQYYHAFRINDHYTGIIKDKSILITGYYRVIGEKRKFNPIFGRKIWEEYLNSVDQNDRIENYKKVRYRKKEKGYKETEVYRPSRKEFWMYSLDSLTLYNNLDPASATFN